MSENENTDPNAPAPDTEGNVQTPVIDGKGEGGSEESKTIPPNVPYDRFKEINNRMKDAEIKANAAAAEALQYKEAIKSLTGGVKSQENIDSGPKREQYQTEEAFTDARYKWNKSNDEKRTNEAKRYEVAQANAAKYTDSCAKAAAKYTDYHQVFNADVLNTIKDPMVVDAVQTHANGGDIAYLLSKNPQEALKIAQLPTHEALFAIKSIVDKVPGSNGQPSNKTSSFSPPIDPLGGNKSNSIPEYSPDMSKEDFDRRYPIE
jgi:hypothetical protein